MKLFEEYFKRHNITNVPLVHHCQEGVVILESEKTKNKLLIFIEWAESDGHPGEYTIKFVKPIHNSFSAGSYFELETKIKKRWHEYEAYFIKLPEKTDSFTAVLEKYEVLLSVWEIFIFVYDGWFSTLPKTIKETLFESINKDNSLDIRIKKYREVYLFMERNFPLITENWSQVFLSKIVEPYSYWLAKLINK